MKKVKVLHILDSFGIGGAETWLLACTKYLKDNPNIQMEFDFLLTGGLESELDEFVRLNGSKTYYKKYSFSRFFSFGFFLRKLLKNGKYNVIHNHGDFVSGWHSLAAIGLLPNIVITHLHNPYNYVNNYKSSFGRRISYNLGKYLMALFTTKLTGTSNFVLDEYGYDKWPFKRIRIQPLYCGFEINNFSFSEVSRKEIRSELGWSKPEIKVALFVGRIGIPDNSIFPNQKNPSFAFKIARKLIEKNTNWNFLFVGLKGVYGEELEAIVLKEGLESRIKFLGIRDDVSKIMSASDAFVFPALWEGLGMVMVEAQCNGLPIIVSDKLPKEAFIIDRYVNEISLNAPIENWIQLIVETSVNNERHVNGDELKVSAFSIHSSVLRLFNEYLND